MNLKLIGFSERTTVGLSSILTLAEDQLVRHWQIDNQDRADFYLINGQLQAQMDSDDFLKNLPRRLCILAMRKIEERCTDESRQFLWGESELPSLRRLVDFLNSLGADPTFQENETRTAAGVSRVGEQPVAPRIPRLANKIGLKSELFDPMKNFLGHLLMEQVQPLAFSLADQPLEYHQLYVDTLEKQYYSPFDPEQLKPYFLATDALRINKLSARQFNVVRADRTLKPRPLDQLIWYAAYFCSRGRVIAGYRDGDIVHLKRWPEVKLSSKDLIRLAGFMHNNAADLKTVQASTNVPLAVVHNYYNACKVCDLIEHTNAADLFEKQNDEEQRQLFVEIGKRLSQIRQSMARKDKD